MANTQPGEMISDAFVANIEELQWRKVLVPPPLRPRYLDDPEADKRLAAARRGASVMDLVRGGRK